MLLALNGQLLSNVEPIFTLNKGQYPQNVLAKAVLNSIQFWVCEDGFRVQRFDDEELESLHDKTVEQKYLNTDQVWVEFVGGKAQKIRPNGDSSKTIYNFFKGNTDHWVTGLKRYSSLMIEQVYPGIDLEISAGVQGIKYNWIVASGKYEDIKVRYHGATASVNERDELEIRTITNELLWTEKIPAVYLISNAESKKIGMKFNVDGDLVGLNFPKQTEKVEVTKRNRGSQLIIDPVLVFSTYSGSLADNFGCTGTYDERGNAYAGGTVFDFGLPATNGAVQVTFGGGVSENLGYGGSRDAAILKFSPDGKNLIYCTYLGGFNNEQPHSMVVDSMMNLYVMGTTRSSNFPVLQSGYDNSWNGNYDFFVVKLDSLGQNMLGGTFVGGLGLDGVGADRSIRSVNEFPLIYNYADEFRGEIITDNDRVYIGGVTYSSDFPHSVSNSKPNVFKNSNAVVYCLNGKLDRLEWSHVVGTTTDQFDAIYGVALDGKGRLFAAGGTMSKGFQTQYGGTKWLNNSQINNYPDAMLLSFDQSTGEFINGRYHSTSLYDQAYFVQTDNDGRPYIYGQSEGNFVGINARFHDDRNTGQFITRFSRDLSTIDLQSTFGANGLKPNLSPSAFLVDRCERIFISGWGGNTNSALYDVLNGNEKTHRNRGNTRNLPITPDAIQKQTDGSDFYIAVFAKDMYDLAFATYFGGITRFDSEAEEHVDGGTSRFDKKGIIYQSLCGGCRQNGVYPTTPGVYSPNMPSPNCNNALFKIDFENLNQKPLIQADFIEVVANDLIDITVKATDPDLFDTLRIFARILNLPAYLGIDTPQITSIEGIGEASLRVFWPTLCGSVLSDTLEIELMVSDCGCPQADTIFSTIKILVNEPPPVLPPEAICVIYERQSDRMRVEWPDATENEEYFDYWLLERTNPDGTVETLDTIRSNKQGFYIDDGIIDPHLNNYCYQLISVNICGKRVPSPYKWCTIAELNTPVPSVHMIEATVKNDRYVELKWTPSDEPDLKEYEVYKYPRGAVRNFDKPDFYTTETDLKDSSFNVDRESFCYEIVVIDKCGHISKPSNPACNVVLRGSTKEWPDYYFDLNWQSYLGWQNGVDQWNLERRHDGQTNFQSIIIQKDSLYRDTDLDYDWGGYEYRVTGKENIVGSQIDYQAQTESNWIYLIQPPEVWVPDAFTVNNDGINEVWGTFPLFVKNYQMKVFDRWGKKIWESSAKKKQWDGVYHDQQIPDGVYAWLLTFDGWDDKTYQKTGTVMVLH